MNITHTHCPRCPVPLPRVCPHLAPYDVIVVDPPWAYGSDTKRPNRTAESHYETIGHKGKEINRHTGAGIQSIIDIVPITSWAKPNAHLYLWTTNPKLPFAFDVMRAWGFVYKTTLTWVKTRKAAGDQPVDAGVVHGGGMGFFFRGATEHVLFGVRGRAPIPTAFRRPNVIMAPPGGEHSKKPDAFYRIVSSVALASMDRPRLLDVFARRSRPGWDVYGNEVDKAA